MNNPTLRSFVVLAVVGMMTVGSLISLPLSRAETTDAGMVPEPQSTENHLYNVPGYQGSVQTYFRNEERSLNIGQGNVNTLLMARNITQGNRTWVDYTFNIQYSIGNTSYIAQIMMQNLVFKVGGQIISAPLKTSSSFELSYSPVVYDGNIPTMDCNITFKGIRVYQEGYANSTFDLSLLHHFRGDWNETDIKVEALFDFNNTRFYQLNGTEYSQGEPFTAEIQYMMMLSDPETMVNDGPIIPSGHTNSTVQYNLTLENGMPLTLSKLNMKNNFTVYNASGAQASMGYSSVVFDTFSRATHGFPDLKYKDTQSIKSDPEITVYHNRVVAISSNQQNDGPSTMLISIVVIGAIAAVAVTFFVLRRKKRGGR